MGIEILLQHGWGFNRRMWDQWMGMIDATLLIQDRGYFGQPFRKTFSNSAEYRVAITHSFGLHLLKLRDIPSLDLLVIISSFFSFKSPYYTHLQMKEGLRTDPIALLNKFYRRCDLPTWQAPDTIDAFLLARDLCKLEECVLDVEMLKNKCRKVCIIHGKKDRVIPYQKAQELHELLPDSHLELYEEGGHGLPITHADSCMQILSKILDHQFYTPLRGKICSNFSYYAQTYDSHALMHKRAALKFTEFIRQQNIETSFHSILEIGSGIGFLSEQLLSLFPHHQLTITDISSSMIRQCQRRLCQLGVEASRVDFKTCDGENFQSHQRFDLIFSGLVFQWFLHLEQSLINLVRHLEERGMLFFSLLLNSSFEKWRQACKDLHLPYTGNALPSLSHLHHLFAKNGWSWECKTSTICQSYSSPLYFFQSIKKTGASTPLRGKQLPLRDFLHLLHHLKRSKGEPFVTNYDLAYICLKPK